MNGNRGQYTSAPLFNMKKKRVAAKPAASAPAENAAPAQEKAPEKRYFALSVMLCAGLPLLFLAVLMIPNNLLRWAYLAVAALSLIAMWVLRAFAKSARGTLTVVHCALALVIALALYFNGQSPEMRNVTSPQGDAISAFTNNDPSALGAALSSLTTEPPSENSNSAAAAAAVSAAEMQLNGFMQAWEVGNVPLMLEYVLPSWKMQQQSPETALWQLTLDSRPTGEYEIENQLGSDGDTSRTIVIRVTMNERNAGAEPVLKRIQAILFRSGQTWYVDPNSLNGITIDQAAEAAAANRPQINSTIAPTATPAPANAGSGITLYYNKDGKGSYYHATRTCEAVNQQWWPMTGFPYELLNSPEYAKLMPCSVCNPPARPVGN